MPADTTTPILGLLLQGTGNNNNSWGTNLNNSVITPIESAIAGVNTISGMTGGAYTLTQANALYNTIILTGTLTSDLTITAPSTANKWTFINNCTGSFYVLLKTSGNTPVNVPAGRNTDVTCDGTSMYRADRHRVGEYFYHAGITVPAGALECNAQTPFRLSAVDLFAALGTTHGTGNGSTTFTLPNATTAGSFLRSRTGSVTAGTVQTSQNLAHTHTFSGALSNTLSIGNESAHTHGGTTNGMNRSNPHSHGYTVTALGAGTGSSPNYFFSSAGASTTDTQDIAHEHTFTTGTGSAHTHALNGAIGLGTVANVSDGGAETRPNNITGILCVRY